MEIYDDAFDRRDHIQSLIDQYEEIMDEIDVIGREAKDKVYSKDVFGRGKSLITDVSRIKWGASSQWLLRAELHMFRDDDRREDTAHFTYFELF